MSQGWRGHLDRHEASVHEGHAVQRAHRYDVQPMGQVSDDTRMPYRDVYGLLLSIRRDQLGKFEQWLGEEHSLSPGLYRRLQALSQDAMDGIADDAVATKFCKDVMESYSHNKYLTLKRGRSLESAVPGVSEYLEKWVEDSWQMMTQSLGTHPERERANDPRPSLRVIHRATKNALGHLEANLKKMGESLNPTNPEAATNCYRLKNHLLSLTQVAAMEPFVSGRKLDRQLRRAMKEEVVAVNDAMRLFPPQQSAEENKTRAETWLQDKWKALSDAAKQSVDAQRARGGLPGF